MDSRSTVERLTAYVRAAYPCVAVETHEEARALGDVLEVAKATGKGFAVWRATEGVRVVLPAARELEDTADLLPALKVRLADTVLVLCDAHTWPFERDPIISRALRDLLAWAPGAGSCVVLLGASSKTTATVEKLVTVVDYTLPSEADYRRIASGLVESNGDAGATELSDAVLSALSGLSMGEAENALALSLVEAKGFDEGVIYREKVAAVKRSGLLEIIDPDPRGLESIGGLENAKDWIRKRVKLFSPEALAFGIGAPRGVLWVGVPGTGKSLACKAVGSVLGLPTVKLDVGSLFNSLVGETERRTREALALAEAIAPCVLWLDEIDKGFAGAGGSGSNDSGVSKRLLGAVLTWLQEKKRAVFMTATANDVTSLMASNPELFRKGRWDEMFTVDLPSAIERAAIFEVHLKARGRDPRAFGFGELETEEQLLTAPDAAAVQRSTEGFTGAEIEAVVNDGLVEAFDAGRELSAADLVAAADRTMPLSRTAKETVEAIRKWGKGRARPASVEDAAPLSVVGQRKLA